MKKALFIHGKPPESKFFNPEKLDPSDDNWIPAAKRRFTLAEYDARSLDMPVPYEPTYERWSAELDRFSDFFDVPDQLTVVGLSLGAGCIVKHLLESNIFIERLVLVAPYLDLTDKREFRPNIEELGHGTLAQSVEVFYSERDDQHILEGVAEIKARVPQVELRNIPDYGHFLWGNSMPEGCIFPELQP